MFLKLTNNDIVLPTCFFNTNFLSIVCILKFIFTYYFYIFQIINKIQLTKHLFGAKLFVCVKISSVTAIPKFKM